MMKPYYTSLLALILCLGYCSLAKENKPTFIQTVEHIHKTTQSNKQQLYQQLWHHYQNPLDLNTATYQDLDRLKLLSHEQLQSLIHYRAKASPILAIYELQNLPHWDTTTTKHLQHFVHITPNLHLPTTKDLLSDQKKLTITLQRDLFSKKKLNHPPLGTKHKLLIKYEQKKTKQYTIRLLGIKDPNEPILANPYYPLPYCAGHLMLEDNKLLKKIIIGHYNIGFGQGLITKSGFNIDKTANAIYTLRANQRGIDNNLSSTRKSGFQGIATTLSHNNFDLTLYASKRNLDNKLHANNHVTSINQRGCIYDSPNALNKKDQLQENIRGTALTYAPNPNFQLGIQAIDYRYSHPIIPRPNYYNTLHFTGDKGYNLSTFGNLLYKNTHLFGEIGLAKNKQTAFLTGLMLSLGKSLDTTILLRHYPPDFHALYGDPFGKNTHKRNEQGLYIGIKLLPLHTLAITAYLDLFRHKTPQYNAHAPTQGQQALMALTYQPTKHTLLQLQAQHHRQPYNRPRVSTITHPALDLHHTTTLSTKLNHTFSPRLQTSTHLKISCHNIQHTPNRYGIAILQKLYYKRKKLTLKPHLSLFYTPHYHNRLYVHTPKLLPGPNFTMLYGQGLHTGITLQYPINKRLSIAMKLSLALFRRKNQTHYQPSLTFQVTWK